MNIQDALKYEVNSSRLASMSMPSWAQGILGRYIARKTRAKWGRFEENESNRKRLLKWREDELLARTGDRLSE